jgi:tyrosine-protein kinase Etk/Wzc
MDQGTTFWSTFRILRARRWWVLLLTVVCAAAIFVGTEFQRINAIVPVESTLVITSQPPQSSSALTSTNAIEDQVSAAFQSIRSSDSVYVTAATLMTMPRSKRTQSVLDILERTQYFAALDLELKESNGEGALRDEHQRIADLISGPRDAQGTFADSGIAGDVPTIVGELRRRITVSVNEAIHSADANRKFDPVIRLTGAFSRPAEGMLAVNMLAVAALSDADRASRQSNAARLVRLGKQRKLLQSQLDAATNSLIAFRSAGALNGRIGLVADQTFVRYQALEQEEQRLRTRLAGLNERAESFRNAISGVRLVDKVTVSASENPVLIAAEQRLQAAKSAMLVVERSNLGLRSDEYIKAESDLISAQRDVDAAQRRTQTMSRWNERFDALAIKLADADAERGELKRSLDQVISDRAVMERQWGRAPQLQSQVDNINRQIKVLDERLGKIDQELTAAATESATLVPVMSLQSNAHLLPVDPVNRWKVLVYGLALSSVVSALLAILMSKLDNTIRTGGDLEREMGVNVLASIPAHHGDPIEGAKVVLNDPLSAVAEAFRLLRTDVQLSHASHPFKTLLVVGARPGDGATTVASNLAIALAQTGRKVVLVDADLRRPMLHMLFGANPAAGVSSVLNGSFGLDAAVQPTEQDGLSILPAGPAVKLASEVLSGAGMGRLLVDLKSRFDTVIVDAPSPIIFADALVLGSQLDVAVIVAKAGHTPRGVEQQARRQLERSKVDLLGVVINQVEPARVDSLYFQERYYAADAGHGTVKTASEL